MFNKFIKIIHNNYYKFFKFIFFLRYLILLFLISITLFLTIPIFFDYERKAGIILENLNKNYNLEVYEYERIKFHPLPFPNLKIKKVLIKEKLSSSELVVKNLKITPKLFSIYNYENFQIKKIDLSDGNIILDNSVLKTFINKIFNQKNKLSLNNFDIQIKNKNKSIIEIEKLKFANFGYKKNLVQGEIFEKKFKIKISNNLKNINFKILNSGLIVDVGFEENKNDEILSGVLKSKILNANLKFNFEYDGKIIKIFKSNFRNKYLTFSNKNEIFLNPYLFVNSIFDIDDFDTKIFQNINLKKLLQSKIFLKKINSKNEINFRSKKFSGNLINELNLKFDLAFGRVDYSKSTLISKNYFTCDGYINFLEEYPVLFFNCLINLNDKKKLIKKFSLKISDENEINNFQVKGSLNILNSKINLKDIFINENYKVSKEDLKYYKETFHSIFFGKSLLETFSLKKIKKFIKEIS